jgi:hypothetical protein
MQQINFILKQQPIGFAALYITFLDHSITPVS